MSSVEASAHERSLAPTQYLPSRSYWKYQGMRSVIAIAGGLLAGLGAGLSLSHGGQLEASFDAAIGLPTVAAIAIGLVAVFAPVHRLVRLGLLGGSALLFLFLGLDVGWGWKIGLGVLGVIVSKVLATIIRFALGFFVKTWSTFVASLLLLLAIGYILGFKPTPAAAQQAGTCESGELIVGVAGEDYIFSAANRQVLTMAVEGERIVLPVQAHSDIERGTVVVELIDSTPFPEWLNKPAIVWTGEIAPNGRRVGGSTESSQIEISRDGGLGTFRIANDAHSEPLPLVAGEGRYRATFTDAVNGGQCFLEARVRLIASPIKTLGGIVAVASSLVGIGVLAGAVAAGPPTPPGWSGKPGGLLKPKSSAGEANLPMQGAAISVVGQRLTRVGDGSATNGGGPTHKLTLKLSVRERERKVHELEVSAGGFLSLVDFSPMLAYSPGGVVEVPIQLRADPREIDLDLLAGELALNVDGYPLITGTARMQEGRLLLELEDDTVIDVRDRPAVETQKATDATEKATS